MKIQKLQIILKLKIDPKKTLGIKLPFLVMIIKNLKKYFTFEVQVYFYILLSNATQKHPTI